MSKVVLFQSLSLSSVPSPLSTNWTCSVYLKSPHNLSRVFMVFHKTCYWIMARSKDSHFFSHVLPFPSVTRYIAHFSLHLNHSSTLHLPLICVGVCSCEEKRERKLMLLSNVLFWLGTAPCVTPIWAVISGNRPAFRLNKPIS